MTVALFVPCYVDQLHPETAIAALELLERYGCTVRVPEGQTCCGQPLANAGLEALAAPAVERFERLFGGVDYVVSPSGSCVHYVKHHTTADVRIHELCEFLVDVLRVTEVDASFPHRVGLHASCHGVRGLRLASGTERVEEGFDKVRGLLEKVDGIDLVPLDRPDACCGFGGVFSVDEPAVSAAMGRERLDDHARNGAEVITGTDVSCLLHLEGLAHRAGSPERFVHVAQILNGGPW